MQADDHLHRGGRGKGQALDRGNQATVDQGVGQREEQVDRPRGAEAGEELRALGADAVQRLQLGEERVEGFGARTHAPDRRSG
ncbi:hypothetical protein CNY89_13170 [Amaricoccus sp. HAR-UPW-R2A-40]|nr:hypothetical protein CNY89_13170 [Amaricoccus sp. HAR-UPW-R2A-40]